MSARTPTGTPDVVSLVDVTAGYRGRPVWTGLDLTLAAGQFLTVLGGNGTGKTTLLRVLLGAMAPLSGSVHVLGEPARRGRPHVGYVPQQRAMDDAVPLRGVDLVRLGADGHRWGPGRRSRARSQAVDAAIAAVGATGYAHRRLGQLSGGQQQRLRIAQALVGDPALLLADEPLLSLDPAAAAQVAALLNARRRAAGTAVVVVTHDINPLLPYTDQVLYLAPNGSSASGTPDDVLTSATLSHLYDSPIDVVRVAGRIVILGASHTVHDDTARSGVR